MIRKNQNQSKDTNIEKASSFPVFLSALLFSIALNITWLIWTFSVLTVISAFININKRFHFIQLQSTNRK
jgi:hypothetical protein